MAEAGQQSARSGTRVDGSHRPANRGERGAVTAQGYLALGLGQRVAALDEQLRLIDEVGTAARSEIVVGALLRIGQEDTEPRWIAVLPGGDATRIEITHGQAQRQVQILSADSPLIRQLRECGPGDVEEIAIGTRIEEVEVLEIC
jgi:hypothetical protein